MRKLSAFIIAAVLAGVLEVATAKSEHTTGNTVITNHTTAVADTIPTKKKKKRTDTIAPNPTPNPNPNPPAPNPNPTPSPSPNPPNPSPNSPTNPNPTSPTNPTTPPNHGS